MGLNLTIAVLLLIAIWFIATYNKFVRWKNLMHEGWSGIDIQLKRRYDLVPNLVETVKGYSSHEQQLFEEIARLRNQCNQAETIKEHSQAENALTASIRNLFAVAEAYPELKASQNFLSLQKSLTEIEDEVQMARRYYNGTVRNLNTMVESFPSLIVAGAMGFKKAEFFEIETIAEKEAPLVKM